MSCIGLCGKGRIMIKVAFCDDDLSVLKELSVLMDRYRVERNQDITYAAFHSPLELLSEVERGTRLDIIFLDVLMPGQDGISAAREIRKYDTSVKIIYLTSSSEYAVVKGLFHVTIHIISKSSDIKTFNITGDLHDGNRHHIRGHQHQHIPVSCFPTQNVHQATGHLSLAPGADQKTYVIDQSGKRHRQEHPPLGFEICKDMILFRCISFLFHSLGFLLPCALPH